MNRDERLPDDENLYRLIQDDVMRRLRCAMPGIIETVNANRTVNVQPAIMEGVGKQDGSTKDVTLPLLLDVPLVQMSLGGFSLTMPPAVGNEVWVVFADRCIDAFWQSGGIQKQAELRFHDLSDGFAFPTKISQPAQLENVSATSAQLRLDSGTAYIELTNAGVINLVGPVNVTGALTVNGAVATTGTLKNNGVDVGSDHVHVSGAEGSDTGIPKAGP